MATQTVNLVPNPPVGTVVYEVECVKVTYEHWTGILSGCVQPYFKVCRDCTDPDNDPEEGGSDVPTPDPCFPRLDDCARVFITGTSFKAYCRYLEYAKRQADGMACYCDCPTPPNCLTPQEVAQVDSYVGDVCTCAESHPRPCNCHNT